LLEFIKPLLGDDDSGGKEEPYEMEEGQESVARLIHMVSHPSSHDIYYDLLMKFKKIFVKGGPKRMKYTVPALVFALINLSQDISNGYFSHD
jgi:vacuolar protein sorting-associated protein 35